MLTNKLNKPALQKWIILLSWLGCGTRNLKLTRLYINPLLPRLCNAHYSFGLWNLFTPSSSISAQPPSSPFPFRV